MTYSPMTRSAIWLLLSIVSAVSMAHYVTAIWNANQPAHFTDLYAPWWGAHELLLRHRNPYSQDVAHEIQTFIYGAPVVPASDDPAGIGGGFAYPPYTALLLWPVIGLSFGVAQKTFAYVAFAATLLSFELWRRSFRWKLPALTWITVALFFLGSFPALQALELQNLSLIAAALIAVTLFLLSTGRLVPAGILLALSTFKPQFTIMLVPWIALWTVAGWPRRRPLAVAFLASMLLLMAWSEWWLPGWFPGFLAVVRAYRHYTFGHSVLDVWFGPTAGMVASIGLVTGVLAFGWRHRSLDADKPGFLLVTSLMLAATVVVIPTLAPHAQLLLLPGWLILLRNRAALPAPNPLSRLLPLAAWALLAWPWTATFGLLIARIWFSTNSLERFWHLPLYTSPVTPIIVMLALGCLLWSGTMVADRDAEALSAISLPSTPITSDD